MAAAGWRRRCSRALLLLLFSLAQVRCRARA